MRTRLYPNDMCESIKCRCTKHALNIHLSPDGDDENGDGSLGNPFASWFRACQEVPDNIKHRVIIRAAAGTYTGFPQQMRHRIGPDGVLALECSDSPTVVAGPYTLTGVVQVGYDTGGAGQNLQVLGADWDIDQWYGKFVRMATGDYAGRCFFVHWSGGDEIHITAPFWYAIAPGDTFEVVEPAVIINCERAPIFSIRSDGTAGRYISNFVMAGLEFITDMLYTSISANWTPYVLNEDCNGLFGLVKFTGLNPFGSILDQKAGIINLSSARVYNPPRSLLTDDTQIMGPSGEACGSVQITAGNTPPTWARCWYAITGSDSCERGVQIGNLGCRNGVYVDSPRAEFRNAGLGYLDVDHRSIATMLYSRVASAGLSSKNAIRVDDGGFLAMSECWIDSSDSNGIILEDLSRLEIGQTGGTTTNIVGHGIKTTRAVSATIDGTVDLEGQAGKIYLGRSNESVNYPAVGAAVTDGQGSYIVR
jgi:hypothetical protein